MNHRKLNKLWFGIVLGIILPALFFYIFIFPRFDQYSNDLKLFSRMMAILLPLLLSRCIFPNVLIFFVFLWADLNRAAKGMLISTVTITGLLVILKLVNLLLAN